MTFHIDKFEGLYDKLEVINSNRKLWADEPVFRGSMFSNLDLQAVLYRSSSKISTEKWLPVYSMVFWVDRFIISLPKNSRALSSPISPVKIIFSSLFLLDIFLQGNDLVDPFKKVFWFSVVCWLHREQFFLSLFLQN